MLGNSSSSSVSHQISSRQLLEIYSRNTLYNNGSNNGHKRFTERFKLRFERNILIKLFLFVHFEPISYQTSSRRLLEIYSRDTLYNHGSNNGHKSFTKRFKRNILIKLFLYIGNKVSSFLRENNSPLKLSLSSVKKTSEKNVKAKTFAMWIHLISSGLLEQWKTMIWLIEGSDAYRLRESLADRETPNRYLDRPNNYHKSSICPENALPSPF